MRKSLLSEKMIRAVCPHWQTAFKNMFLLLANPLNRFDREGDEVFKTIDIKNYSQRVFSMYGGTLSHVTLRCITPLLDTMVERFGTREVQYTKIDDGHFSVSAKVEVSDQFFGWLLGFGKRVRLTGNNDVVKKFTVYLDKVRGMY